MSTAPPATSTAVDRGLATTLGLPVTSLHIPDLGRPIEISVDTDEAFDGWLRALDLDRHEYHSEWLGQLTGDYYAQVIAPLANHHDVYVELTLTRAATTADVNRLAAS